MHGEVVDVSKGAGTVSFFRDGLGLTRLKSIVISSSVFSLTLSIHFSRPRNRNADYHLNFLSVGVN